MRILEARKHPIVYTNGQSECLTMIEAIIDRTVERFKTVVLDVDGSPKKKEDYFNEEFILAGFAGTGKTTIAENILNYAKHKGINTIVLAPTNKACNVLRTKLKNIEVNTLHSMLYGTPDDTFGQEWTLSAKIAKSLILVDESSMVSTDLYNDIKEAAEYGNIIIFMGDSFQLEPVGKNPELFERINYELTEVKRQVNDSPILKIATVIRTMRNIFVYEDDESDTYCLYDTKNALIREYIKYVRDNKDAIFIVDTNKERTAINNKVREHLAYDDIIVNNERLISIANSSIYANGETFTINNIIEVKKLDFEIPQFKGSLKVKGAFVKAIDANDNTNVYLLVVDYDQPTLYHQTITKMLEEDKEDKYQFRKIFGQLALRPNKKNDDYGLNSLLNSAHNKNKPAQFSKSITIVTYGYAISAHKSQGSQWEHIFINQVWAKPTWSIERWFYTALTRSSKTLHLSRENQALNFKSNDKINKKYEQITQ